MAGRKIGDSHVPYANARGSAGVSMVSGIADLRTADGDPNLVSTSGHARKYRVGPLGGMVKIVSVAFYAATEFIAVGFLKAFGISVFSAVASFAAAGIKKIAGAAEFDADAAFASTGKKRASGASLFASIASFTADGIGIGGSRVTVDSDHRVTVDGVRRVILIDF